MLLLNHGNGSTASVVFGNGPSNYPGRGRLTIEPVPSSPDTDGDGVMDALETACGTNASRIDSDADTIPDLLELFGNDGFSFSEGVTEDANPWKTNVYVEIDTMNKSGVVKQPYSSLAADMATIFNADGHIELYLDVDSDNGGAPSLHYTKNTGLGGCGSVASCVTADSLRADNFSLLAPERRPFFHYGVYVDMTLNYVGTAQTPTEDCMVTGISKTLNTTFIVALGSTCTDKDSSTAGQLGTTVHELGHNLNLIHNGNGQAISHDSIFHKSVMNYRFTVSGVPGRTGVLASTYSFGSPGHAACETSPKLVCQSLNAAQQCGGEQFYLGGQWCDTDPQEWGAGGWLTADFVNGVPRAPGAGDARVLNANAVAAGAAGANAEDASVQPRASRAGLLPPMTPQEFAPLRAAIERNQDDRTTSMLRATGPDHWNGDVPDPAVGRRAALVTQLVRQLEERGLQPGKDFHVSADGLSVFQ
jgi:hypothetical protein